MLVFVCTRHDVYKRNAKKANFESAANDVNILLQSALHIVRRPKGKIARLKALTGQTLETKLDKIVDIDSKIDVHIADRSGHGDMDDEEVQQAEGSDEDETEMEVKGGYERKRQPSTADGSLDHYYFKAIEDLRFARDEEVDIIDEVAEETKRIASEVRRKVKLVSGALLGDTPEAKEGEECDTVSTKRKNPTPAQQHAEATLLGAKADNVAAEADAERARAKRVKIENDYELQVAQHKLQEVKHARDHELATQRQKQQHEVELLRVKAEAEAKVESAKAATIRANTDRKQVELLTALLQQARGWPSQPTAKE
jgi:hypothetical protein